MTSNSITSSTYSHLQNYNIDWTLRVWRCNSDRGWVNTLQKVATYSIVILMTIATFEIVFKNLILISCFKLVNATKNSCFHRTQKTESQIEKPVTLPVEKAPLIAPQEVEIKKVSHEKIEDLTEKKEEQNLLDRPLSPQHASPPPSVLEAPLEPPALILGPSEPPSPLEVAPQNISTVTETPLMKENLKKELSFPLPKESPSVETPPSSETINPDSVGLVGLVTLAAAASVGWPVALAAATTAAIGGTVLHHTDQWMPAEPDGKPSAYRNIFTSGRDRMYGGLNSIKNFLYKN